MILVDNYEVKKENKTSVIKNLAFIKFYQLLDKYIKEEVQNIKE